jgi:hypothetical protein
MMIMRFFRILSLYAAGLCLVAQTTPKTSSKPPEAATPAAGSTSGNHIITGPEGVTFPLDLTPPPVIPPDRVVFQVGDLKLTSLQVSQILDSYSESQRGFANGPGRAQFIDQVVQVLLLSEEGRRRKLNETEAYKNQIMYANAAILAARTNEDIKGAVHGDEALLKGYFEAHKSEYEMIHVYHIMIRMQGSPAILPQGQKDLTEAEALAKALEIRQKIVQGASFADQARFESADPGSGAKGGDLGFLKHGQTAPSFEETAFALPIGELSQPVKTNFGYHLIRVDERRLIKPFEELRPELEGKLEVEVARKFLEDLKAKTKIVIDPDFSAAQKPAGVLNVLKP